MLLDNQMGILRMPLNVLSTRPSASPSAALPTQTPPPALKNKQNTNIQANEWWFRKGNLLRKLALVVLG